MPARQVIFRIAEDEDAIADLEATLEQWAAEMPHPEEELCHGERSNPTRCP
jgi:hypothetical protein